MQIEWEMSAVNGEIIFERELQLPAPYPERSRTCFSPMVAALPLFFAQRRGRIETREPEAREQTG